MTATEPDPAGDYLARLDVALRDVPFGTAREIRAGVEEELASLPSAERERRIAELGDPAVIAAEAAADSQAPAVPSPPAAPASAYGRGPGYVVLTALTVAVGGLVVPLLGWVVGLVLLWTGRVWTLLERWIATLAPLAATALVVGVWWLVQSGPSPEPSPATGSGFHPPEVVSPGLGRMMTWWGLVAGGVVGNVVVGIWLLVTGLRRTRA